MSIKHHEAQPCVLRRCITLIYCLNFPIVWWFWNIPEEQKKYDTSWHFEMQISKQRSDFLITGHMCEGQPFTTGQWCVNLMFSVMLAWKIYWTNSRIELRLSLSEASFGLRVLSLPASVCVSVCLYVCVNHEFVRAITLHPFKLESPNLKRRCKTPCLRSLLFCGVIDLDLQGQI